MRSPRSRGAPRPPPGGKSTGRRAAPALRVRPTRTRWQARMEYEVPMAAPVPRPRRTDGSPDSRATRVRPPPRSWDLRVSRAGCPPRRSVRLPRNRSSLPLGIFPPTGPGRVVGRRDTVRGTPATACCRGGRRPGGSPPRRSRHRLPPSIHEGPGLTGARDPRPRPAGRLRPADGGRCALTGRCHATRQFMFRLRRLAFTHPHRSAVRAARKWFLPRPSSRRSRVCPSTAPDRGARGGLAGSQHPRLRPLAGTVPPNTEKEKWCGMLQRAPTVARLAPKSGQRCFGSR